MKFPPLAEMSPITPPPIPMFEIKPERIEPIPTDYALAYSALARRFAAVDAILRSEQLPEHCIKRLRAESDAAMMIIQQVETVQFTISSHPRGHQ